MKWKNVFRGNKYLKGWKFMKFLITRRIKMKKKQVKNIYENDDITLEVDL
jgi:hypothetical protein